MITVKPEEELYIIDENIIMKVSAMSMFDIVDAINKQSETNVASKFLKQLMTHEDLKQKQYKTLIIDLGKAFDIIITKDILKLHVDEYAWFMLLAESFLNKKDTKAQVGQYDF